MSDKAIWPVDLLTDEQKAVVQKFASVVESWKGKISDESYELASSEITLFRYCYGYAWKLEDSEKYLTSMLKWRETYKPHKIRIKDLKFAKDCIIIQHGFDLQGHPIVWMLVDNNEKIPKTEENIKERIKTVIYCYERAIAQMKKPIYNLTLIIDFRGGTLNIPQVKQFKGIFEELGLNYAERIHKIFILNAPWTIGVCWSFIKPFLYPHVIQKYVFVNPTKPKEIQKELSQFIHPDELARYGTKDFKFDMDEQLELEKKIYGDE